MTFRKHPTEFIKNFINEKLNDCDLLVRYSVMEKAGKVVTDEEWRSLPDDLLKVNKALKLMNEARMKN